jgi:tyrosyl-tRNA synthetase
MTLLSRLAPLTRITIGASHSSFQVFTRSISSTIDFQTLDYDNNGLIVDQQLLQNELSQPLLSHLRERGLISNCTDEEGLSKLLLTSKQKLYCGADPTAKSLHLGNLLPLLILLHFNIRGHDIVGIVGGATGAVGDPSGRTDERKSMADETRLDNLNRIKNQLHGFFTNGVNYLKVQSFKKIIEEGECNVHDNYEWWKDMGFLEFLSKYGRFIRVSSMLARDSVKGRLESENGIGFNEFTYQILQAYDFWYLFSKKNVTIQVGGNDQWGNITAGIDLITRLKSNLIQTEPQGKQNKEISKKESFGLTVPLLTTSTGEKFGKSAGNAVFIDPEITPTYEIYQFFIKTPDSEVAKLLKIFTFIPLEQISEILEHHSKDPSMRVAQRILATEVTDLIHGVGASKDAKIVTSLLHPLPGNPYPDIPTERLLSAFSNANILITLPRDEFFGKPYSHVVSKLHGCSKNEAKKLISNGAVYEGYDRVRIEPSDSVLLTEELLIDNQILLLRVGKGKYYIAKFGE